jgi:hypothetical protein
MQRSPAAKLRHATEGHRKETATDVGGYLCGALLEPRWQNKIGHGTPRVVDSGHKTYARPRTRSN